MPPRATGGLRHRYFRGLLFCRPWTVQTQAGRNLPGRPATVGSPEAEPRLPWARAYHQDHRSPAQGRDCRCGMHSPWGECPLLPQAGSAPAPTPSVSSPTYLCHFTVCKVLSGQPSLVSFPTAPWGSCPTLQMRRGSPAKGRHPPGRAIREQSSGPRSKAYGPSNPEP